MWHIDFVNPGRQIRFSRRLKFSYGCGSEKIATFESGSQFGEPKINLVSKSGGQGRGMGFVKGQ
jgi:hypothetical protein